MHLNSLSNMAFQILYKLLQIVLSFVRVVLRCVLSILYRGKGKVVPAVTNPLLLKSASKLASDIREGKCKSEVVIQAYIDRILEVEPYINAMAHSCFQEALQRSREIDAVIASGKYTTEQISREKPLLGIPISVKCLFHVKNMPCNGGCLFYSGVTATKDAPAVAALKKAGAIVIATTNVPELGLSIETFNKLYGRTCNPHDTNRTCGGSSGGEAALISSGASVLGLGNDICGSLRFPALFTGIFSHKPSTGLVSNRGYIPLETPHAPGEFCNSDVYKFAESGPMCRYAEDLITSMKVLTLDNEVKMKFDRQINFKKVKIYYLKELRNPLFAPVDQEILDALQNAVSYFQKQYNTTPNEVEMPFLFDIVRCINTVMEPILKEFLSSLSEYVGFKLDYKMELIKSLLGKSKLCLSTICSLGLFSHPLLSKKCKISYYRKLTEQWIKEFSNLLDENSVLFMPTFPVVAPYHFETFPLMPNVCYSGLFNVLGLPATHCPIGFNKQGLPCGIQIIGRHNSDPLTIACAVELEKAFGRWKPYTI